MWDPMSTTKDATSPYFPSKFPNEPCSYHCSMHISSMLMVGFISVPAVASRTPEPTVRPCPGIRFCKGLGTATSDDKAVGETLVSADV